MILFSLKIKTSRPPQFRKGNMRSVQEVQSAFMRMDVNGDGSLTKREMLAADEFTPEEVRESSDSSEERYLSLLRQIGLLETWV